MRLRTQKRQRSNVEHGTICKTEGKTLPPPSIPLTQRPLGHSAPLIHSRMSLSLCSAINSTRQALSRKIGSTSARGALVTSPSWPGFVELFPGEKQHRPRRSCTRIPTVLWISHGIANFKLQGSKAIWFLRNNF